MNDNTDIYEVNIDNIQNVINDIILNFCNDHDIDSNDIPPQKWNAIIQDINKIVFKRNRTILRDNKTKYNEYTIDKVEYIYSVYKYLSNVYGQEITLKKFSDMTGICLQEFYDWNNNVLSSQRSDILEKIHADNEESLESMLHDKRYNPMKILPSLNRKHSWNLPGVTREKASDRIQSNNLPTLGISGHDHGAIESND